MAAARLETARIIPLDRFVQEHPFEVGKDSYERFVTLDFSYLEEDRLSYRQSKYDMDKTDFVFHESQLQGKGIFEIEGRKILNLLDVCKEKGIPEIDIVKIFPAIHMCLYTHQLQFRETGEPYSIHSLDLAIEAVRDYDADWQTAALFLVHDVKEEGARYRRPVPPWMVNYVYYKLSDKLGYSNTREAIRDAHFLTRGMEAVHKAASYKGNKSAGEKVRDGISLLTRRKKLPIEAESIKKFYSVILGDENRLVENARIALVKPLDRKHFLETAASMPPEKQREKALETLLIHVPMAEAMHLYQVRDRLARLALGILDPDEYAYIDSLVEASEALRRKLEGKDITMILQQALSPYGVIHVQLSSPDFLRMYNLVGNTETAVKPVMGVQIIVDRLESADRQDWMPTTDQIREILEEHDVHIEVSLMSKKDFIYEGASILDLYPGRSDPILGTRDEWRSAAEQLIRDVRRRFKEAKKLNDFSYFLESTVAGHKMVIDRKHNNRILVPDEATLFDVLFIIYGPQVFRGLKAHIKVGKEVRFVSNEDFGRAAPAEMELLGLEVISEEITEGSVTPRDIRKSRHLGVRQELIRLLEEKGSTRTDVREYIIEDGYYFLSHDYEEAWIEHIGFTPGDKDVKRVLPLNVDHLRAVIPGGYKTNDELAYAIGTGRIPRSVYRRIIHEMIRFRENMVFFSFTIKDQGELKKIQSILDEYGIQLVAQQTQDNPYIGGQEHMIWFHESQLGDDDKRLDRFNRLFIRFTDEGISYYRSASWNKIPMAESPLPEVQEVANLVQEI